MRNSEKSGLCTCVRACLKNGLARSSRCQEVQIFTDIHADRSLLASAATILEQALSRASASAIVCLLLLACALSCVAEPRYEADIRAFELGDATNAPPQNAILFVGSSSIRLWTNLSSAFPGQPIIKRGFGGSYLSEAVAYAPRIVLPYHPRIVLLYAGDNDIADGKQPEEIAQDFDSFVKMVHSALPRTRIGYLAIKPSPVRMQFLAAIRKTNSLIRQRTRRDRHLFYVDTFSPMLDRKGQPNPALFEPDGLHPNARAYEIWASRIKPFLKKG